MSNRDSDWQALSSRIVDAQNRRRVWHSVSNVVGFILVTVVIVYFSTFAPVRITQAPFEYLGEKNADGIIVYNPVRPIVCMGEDVAYNITVDIIRPHGHVVVKTQLLRGESNAVGEPSFSSRFLTTVTTYEGIPRRYSTAGLDEGQYYIGVVAFTELTQSGIYIVPFEVDSCERIYNSPH